MLPRFSQGIYPPFRTKDRPTTSVNKRTTPRLHEGSGPAFPHDAKPTLPCQSSPIPLFSRLHVFASSLQPIAISFSAIEPLLPSWLSTLHLTPQYVFPDHLTPSQLTQNPLRSLPPHQLLPLDPPRGPHRHQRQHPARPSLSELCCRKPWRQGSGSGASV